LRKLGGGGPLPKFINYKVVNMYNVVECRLTRRGEMEIERYIFINHKVVNMYNAVECRLTRRGEMEIERYIMQERKN
jgi:hypothetical protein